MPIASLAALLILAQASAPSPAEPPTDQADEEITGADQPAEQADQEQPKPPPAPDPAAEIQALKEQVGALQQSVQTLTEEVETFEQEATEEIMNLDDEQQFRSDLAQALNQNRALRFQVAQQAIESIVAIDQHLAYGRSDPSDDILEVRARVVQVGLLAQQAGAEVEIANVQSALFALDAALYSLSEIDWFTARIGLQVAAAHLANARFDALDRTPEIP